MATKKAAAKPAKKAPAKKAAAKKAPAKKAAAKAEPADTGREPEQELSPNVRPADYTEHTLTSVPTSVLNPAFYPKPE